MLNFVENLLENERGPMNGQDQTYQNQTLSKVRFRFVAGKVRANCFRCHSDKNTAAYGIFSV
jgi:hypothetical protein